MDAKYIVIKSRHREILFTFPPEVSHLHMFEAVTCLKEGPEMRWYQPHRLAEPISAGFITRDHLCYGESISLGIKSRYAVDTALLRNGGA